MTLFFLAWALAAAPCFATRIQLLEDDGPGEMARRIQAQVSGDWSRVYFDREARRLYVRGPLELHLPQLLSFRRGRYLRDVKGVIEGGRAPNQDWAIDLRYAAVSVREHAGRPVDLAALEFPKFNVALIGPADEAVPQLFGGLPRTHFDRTAAAEINLKGLIEIDLSGYASRPRRELRTHLENIFSGYRKYLVTQVTAGDAAIFFLPEESDLTAAKAPVRAVHHVLKVRRPPGWALSACVLSALGEFERWLVFNYVPDQEIALDVDDAEIAVTDRHEVRRELERRLGVGELPNGYLLPAQYVKIQPACQDALVSP